MEPSDPGITAVSLLFVFFSAGMLLGLLRPSLVLWWAKGRLRGRRVVFLLFGLPALLSVLAVGVLAPSETEEALIPEDGAGSQIGIPSSPAAVLFFPSQPPIYAVSADEEERFQETLRRVFPEERLSQAAAVIGEVGEYYPEGYFVLVRVAPQQAEEFAFFLQSDVGAGTVETAVHELTHIVSGSACSFRGYRCLDRFGRSGKDAVGFLVEDKGIVVEIPASLRNLPGGREAFRYIAAPNYIDRTYLQENDQNILVTLDETNAYIKSVRFTRAHKRFATDDRVMTSQPATLARQLYLLSLQLKNLKEHHRDLWEELKAEKAFAFVAMRLVAMAEAEIALAEQEGLADFEGLRSGAVRGFGSSGFDVGTVEENLRFFDANRPLLDEFFGGVRALDGMGPEELRSHGAHIAIYEP